MIALAVCLAAISCSPLRIVMNSKDAEGRRTILTSNQSLFRYGFSDIFVALGARVAPKDSVLAILVTCDKDTDHGIINKDDRMLIRLKDDSTITLKNLYDREFDSSTYTTETTERVSSFGYSYGYDPWFDEIYISPYEISSFVPRKYVRKETNSYALYLVTKKQMQDIINKGVTKLRIEIEDRDLDMPDPENASAIFAAQYDLLYKTAKQGVTRSEF